MIDPVAIRSYLASQSQGGLGGGGGRGGIQTMLANLRQQLYGPQALQQGGGGPGVATQQFQGRDLTTQGGQQGIVGRGGNFQAFGPAALRQLQGSQSGQPGFEGTEWMQPDQMLGLRPALQSANGGGLQAPTGTAVDPEGGLMNVPPEEAARIQRQMEDLRARGVDIYGNPVRDIQWGGGTNPNAPTTPQTARPMPFPTYDPNNTQGNNQGPPVGFDLTTAQPLPATMTAPVLPPAQASGGVAGAVGPALQGAQKPGASVPTQVAAANVSQAAQQAKPTRTAAAPPAVNPAVLGAQDFRGPNARRIVQARSGIYNNVRQALRKPAGGR